MALYGSIWGQMAPIWPYLVGAGRWARAHLPYLAPHHAVHWRCGLYGTCLNETEYLNIGLEWCENQGTGMNLGYLDDGSWASWPARLLEVRRNGRRPSARTRSAWLWTTRSSSRIWLGWSRYQVGSDGSWRSGAARRVLALGRAGHEAQDPSVPT